MLRYFEHNRDHLEPWEPVRPTDFYTLGFWQKRLVENRQDAELGRSLRYFLQLVGDAPPAVVGAVNFTNVIRGAFCACHLGYGLARAEQGQGLMREALTAALPEVAARLSLHRVMANYQPQNERSGACWNSSASCARATPRTTSSSTAAGATTCSRRASFRSESS